MLPLPRAGQVGGPRCAPAGARAAGRGRPGASGPPAAPPDRRTGQRPARPPCAARAAAAQHLRPQRATRAGGGRPSPAALSSSVWSFVQIACCGGRAAASEVAGRAQGRRMSVMTGPPRAARRLGSRRGTAGAKAMRPISMPHGGPRRASAQDRSARTAGGEAAGPRARSRAPAAPALPNRDRTIPQRAGRRHLEAEARPRHQGSENMKNQPATPCTDVADHVRLGQRVGEGICRRVEAQKEGRRDPGRVSRSRGTRCRRDAQWPQPTPARPRHGDGQTRPVPDRAHRSDAGGHRGGGQLPRPRRSLFPRHKPRRKMDYLRTEMTLR